MGISQPIKVRFSYEQNTIDFEKTLRNLCKTAGVDAVQGVAATQQVKFICDISGNKPMNIHPIPAFSDNYIWLVKHQNEAVCIDPAQQMACWLISNSTG